MKLKDISTILKKDGQFFPSRDTPRCLPTWDLYLPTPDHTHLKTPKKCVFDVYYQLCYQFPECLECENINMSLHRVIDCLLTKYCLTKFTAEYTVTINLLENIADINFVLYQVYAFLTGNFSDEPLGDLCCTLTFLGTRGFSCFIKK
jgi:hypothetical protein